jgi:hypothetical protein
MSNYNSRCVKSIKSALASFALSEDGFMTLFGSAPPSIPTGDASFTIERVDNILPGEEVAPFNPWLRATNLVGFNVSEPAGDTNAYDPTQHRMTYVWELPDEGYQPIVQPNIPNAFRSFTTDYGKQISVVFTTPGVKVVRCFVFDEAGNWAIAEHVFGPNGQSNEVQDPEVYFLNRTIYVSQTENWEGVPAGVPTNNRVSTIQAAANRLNSLGDVFKHNRVLFRCGETWNNAPGDSIGSTERRGGVFIDQFGTGDHRPRFIYRVWGSSPKFSFFSSLGRSNVMANLEILGPWNASTETGHNLNMFNQPNGIAVAEGNILFYRMKFDGWHMIRVADGQFSRAFFDSEVSNWKNFGLFSLPTYFALIWCDIHQPPDGLNGISNNPLGNGNSNAMYMGNLHGCFRGGNKLHCSRTSFFNKGGWDRDGNFINNPPTSGQPATRLSGGGGSNRAFVNFTMCSFESTGDLIRQAFFGSTGGPEGHGLNSVYDRNVICATAHTETFFNMNYAGITLRNNYFVRPDVIGTNGSSSGRFVNMLNLNTADWSPGLTQSAPDTVHHNTFIILGPSSNINGSQNLNPQPAAVIGNATRAAVATVAHNLVYAPGLTTPVGTSFEPFLSEPLAGFSPRYGGNRWNFPPVGHARGNTFPQIRVGEAKVRDGGTNSNVAPGEWIAVDYPNYAGVCRGALDAALATSTIRDIILSNSSQKHELSVSGTTSFTQKNFTDPVLYPEGCGRISIQFLTDRIRIQNNSGVTWTSTNLLWFKLDLSDYLMGPQPGTISPSTIPFYVPTTGSVAIVGSRTNPWPWNDFAGNVRLGSIRKTGTAETAGVHRIGAA